MSLTNLERQELQEFWSEADANLRVRGTFPLFGAHGTRSTATVYFEVEPGDYLGRHTDSAEEILFVVEGEGEALVGDERVRLEPRALALVPELVPHAVYASGEHTLKVLGFFSAAHVQSIFDEPLQPIGGREFDTRALAATV